jgi:hypothetical protein
MTYRQHRRGGSELNLVLFPGRNDKLLETTLGFELAKYAEFIRGVD